MDECGLNERLWRFGTAAAAQYNTYWKEPAGMGIVIYVSMYASPPIIAVTWMWDVLPNLLVYIVYYSKLVRIKKAKVLFQKTQSLVRFWQLSKIASAPSVGAKLTKRRLLFFGWYFQIYFFFFSGGKIMLSTRVCVIVRFVARFCRWYGRNWILVSRCKCSNKVKCIAHSFSTICFKCFQFAMTWWDDDFT